MYRAKRTSPLLLPHFRFHFSTTSAPTSAATSTSTSTSPTQESILYVLKKLEKDPPKALEFFNHALSNPALHPLTPPAFHTVLRALAHRDHLAHFWPLLRRMSSLRHPLDRPAYLTLLDRLNKHRLPADAAALSDFYNSSARASLSAAAASAAVESILAADRPDAALAVADLSENAVVQILRGVRDHPSKALAFFRWASTAAPAGGYKHGSLAHNAMARVLGGREESADEFWAFVDAMRKGAEGFEMDIDTYVKLSRQFLKGKRFGDAVRLYEFMMDGPYKPAVQDCGMLLRQISLSATPDLGLVWRVVGKYEAGGYGMSKVVYDGIHRALTSNGRFDEAEETLGRMRGEGFEPDNITYSQLVYGLCKAKRFEEARKVLDDMEEGGCVPDLKTWTVLIQGHCAAGEVDEALRCLMRMVEKDCAADADVVDVLVKGLCCQRRAEGAYTLVTEMVKKSELRPWQATYKYLIQELLGENKLEEALHILGMMKGHNFPPFADPFGPYIAKYGTVEDARELLKKLSVKNYPTATAYLHIFKHFFGEGRYTEAQDLLFKCPHHIRKNEDISKLFGSTGISMTRDRDTV
ncbi:pentatricopeptide repeat-containing protein, chloroplastic [Iris pallida]|uniref:Pentatricopeptide repeat-containing protein, chloroplastic n=1 Tax=Iris pallida TaxID=29817 RepID=A0AAX6EEE0_IRIPA|nr:pentatricopeptide repeat-containing protein, chloroplastic [Iris pallida]